MIYLKLYDDSFSDSLNIDLYSCNTLDFADIIQLFELLDLLRKEISINI